MIMVQQRLRHEIAFGSRDDDLDQDFLHSILPNLLLYINIPIARRVATLRSEAVGRCEREIR
jgi:hypothetical protein